MTQNRINTTTTLLQSIKTSTSSVVTCNTTTPFDNTIPQNNEGTQVLTLNITPFYSTSTLDIYFSGVATKDTNAGNIVVALFQDSTANAIEAMAYQAAASTSNTVQIRHIMTSGTTSATTFKIRVGPDSNVAYINGDNAGNRLMGGVSITELIINEYL